MALLEIKDLQVQISGPRRSLVALDGVCLEVDEGEVLGLVGESGAGKSLTVDAIMGLLEPPMRMTGGQIWLAGRRIDILRGEAMRQVRGAQAGVILQDPMTSLNPLYSIGRQLVQTIRVHADIDRRAARQRALQLLAEVGIPSPAKRFSAYPHQLSGGMRQRVVIALALCARPRLIIADEPTTALDVSIQAQILDLLKRLVLEQGTAVLLISHDMGVIAEMADRVAVMYAGQIVETAPTPNLVEDPRHPYTRGLMESIPSIDSSVDRLVQIEGSMPDLAERPSCCAFSPRCPRRFDRCLRERPVLKPVSTGRSSSCWLVDSGGMHD